MSVSLRQLQAFVAVAELGRFNLAAGRLNLTQSAVSILIRELEAELRQRLFDRHTRMVCLTDAGREFFPQAHKLLEDLDLAVSNIREYAALRRGRVTIASAIVLSATLLPQIIERFRAAYPDIGVRLCDMPEEEIRPALKRNEVDIAVGTVADEDPEIETTHLLQDQLVLVCRSDHPFAQKGRVPWRELVQQDLIVLARRNPLRELVDRTLIAVAPQFRPTHEVHFSTTAISMIASGLGVAVLPQNASQLAPQVDVVTVELYEPVVRREIGIIQNKSKSLSTAAENMKMFMIHDQRSSSAVGEIGWGAEGSVPKLR